MNIVEINNKYKTELIESIQTGKINNFKELYFDKLQELITILELINTDFILCYLFLCQFLCLQIDLYKKYSLVMRMVLLLRFR
jgi:hypothetical protein